MRMSWDEYFLDVCRVVASRSTCLRGPDGNGVGCVLVRDRQILATGYAGSLPGLPHCDEAGHDMRSVTYEDGSKTDHCFRTVHAEANSVAQAARNGISTVGATAYLTMMACETCTKLLLAAGIEKIVTSKPYHAQNKSVSVLTESGWDLLEGPDSNVYVKRA